MKDADYLKKFKAAQRLLKRKEITYKTFEDIRALVKGADSQVDKKLAKCSKAFKVVRQVQKGDVLSLSEKVIKALPAESRKEKKRKKALLLFFKHWKQLRAEVKRVAKTYQSLAKEEDKKIQEQAAGANRVGKLAASAKGPLGLITVAAVGVVAVKLLINYLNSSAVEVVIKNLGCAPITPVVSRSISLPGVKLPSETISDGGQAIAKLPPVKLTVDGTQPGTIKVTALAFTMNFELETQGIDLVFNDQNLLGNRTSIDLKQKPQHELVILCTNSKQPRGS